MVAAGQPGNAATVKLLLARGVMSNPTANPDAESSPLLEASLAGDAEVMQALLEKGSDIQEIGGAALANSVGAGCTKCIDLLVARKMDPQQYSIALAKVAVMDDPKLIRMLLDHGADVNAVDPTGRTALMYAAVSDVVTAEQVKMLLDKGAKVDAKSQHPKSERFRSHRSRSRQVPRREPGGRPADEIRRYEFCSASGGHKRIHAAREYDSVGSVRQPGAATAH